MIETELLRLARANDPEGRRTLTAEIGLAAARSVLGEPKSRADGLRALVRESGAAPALAYYLAAIAEDATDAEVRRASELVRRVSVDRWGPPEREAIGRFVGDAAPALGAEECIEQVEFLAQYPDGDALRDACEGAWDALSELSLEADEHQRFQWQPGFQVLLSRMRAPAPSCALAWTARPASARIVARALFAAQDRERGSVMPALDALPIEPCRPDVQIGEGAEGLIRVVERRVDRRIGERLGQREHHAFGAASLGQVVVRNGHPYVTVRPAHRSRMPAPMLTSSNPPSGVTRASASPEPVVPTRTGAGRCAA